MLSTNISFFNFGKFSNSTFEMQHTARIDADERIERLLVAAKAAGCPRDQIARFIRGGYFPIIEPDGGMLNFHRYAREADDSNGPTQIALGGKRGPGKTHAEMAQIGLDDCQRFPRLKALFIRKLQRASKESLEDISYNVFRYTPHTPITDGVEFPNKSRIIIGGYKDDKDIEKYLGLEYDVISVGECTQISEEKMDKLRGSLRSSKGFRPRMYLDTNADGPGLLWFKKTFIEPKREGRETNTRFLDVTSIKNPFINKEYDEWLDSLHGALRKAWRDGDWDAFAGMAFPEWNIERHVVKPFEIPSNWLKWRATDWGYASPFCTLWLTKDPDTNRIYIYRELYQANLTDRQQARQIIDMSPLHEKIFIHYADPALWERKSRQGEVFSTADEYRNEGIILTRGDNNRLSGKRKVNNLLADLPDGEPGLQVFDTCINIIEELGSLASDQHNPEDVDTTQKDHAYDTMRYGLTNERRIENAQAPKAKRQESPLIAVFGRS